MTDLPQFLRDLADTLDVCAWNHPLGSAAACRQAAEEIERRAAAFTSLRQLCDSYAADVGRLSQEIERLKAELELIDKARRSGVVPPVVRIGGTTRAFVLGPVVSVECLPDADESEVSDE